jgi:hypothetical protein
MTPAEQAFLAELSELSRKRGVGIGGCGCCGSPFLTDHDKEYPGGYEESDDDGRISWNPEKS